MRWLALGILLAAGMARADVPPVPLARPTAGPPQPPGLTVGTATPPLSIWRPDGAGGLEHLQSGLLCPSQVGRYQRTNSMIYNPFGLDVSCDYATPGANFDYAAEGADITVYLTRREGTDVDAAMAEAKREFLQLRAGLHPQLILDTTSNEGGLQWLTAVYAVDGQRRDLIWIADLGGWTVEYRMTYADAQQSRVDAELKQFTALVTQSAGPRLSACAKSQAPERGGARIVVDPGAQTPPAILASILADAAAVAERKAAAAGPAPIWCVEQPTKSPTGIPLVYWRGVNADGSDASTDRMTPMTRGSPPTLQIAPAALASAAPTWVATLQTGDRTMIYAYFDSRPPPQAVVDLFADIVVGKAKPLGGYDAAAKSLIISTPAEP